MSRGKTGLMNKLCKCHRSSLSGGFLGRLERCSGMGVFSSTGALRISLGDGSWWSVGVVRRHSIAICGSCPLSLAFSYRCLTVCTILSANPFERGYNGDDVTCSNPYVSANCLNSSEEYWVPLSEMKRSGIPCSSEIPLSFRTIRNLLNGSATSR